MSAELRVHARIHVNAKIQVHTAEVSTEAHLKDLSFGGARFATQTLIGHLGQAVRIELPAAAGKRIEIIGEIVRIEPEPDGTQMMGVRFADASPEMREQLNQLIELLLTKRGSPERAHPRVARRMDIRYGELSELKAILHDISLGGLAMTVVDPLVFQEHIDVTVPDTGGDQLLVLRAKVVHQRAVPTDVGTTAYRVGLEFAPMRPETRRCLVELLQFVMESTE